MTLDLDTIKAGGAYLATALGGGFLGRIILSRDSLERKSNSASETAIDALETALKAAEKRASDAEKKAEHLEQRLNEQQVKLDNALRRIAELERKEQAK